MSQNIPWPCKGDVLFEQTEDWWYNAFIGGVWNRWPVYAAGYKQGADVLVQHVIETRSSRESLVCPIVFLYRHSFEIALKHLILLGRRIMGREGKHIPNTPVSQKEFLKKLFHEHSLSRLWEKCRPVIEHVFPNDSRKDEDAVGGILKQFDDKDPLGQVFRYPADTQGKPFFSDTEQINVSHLADVANRVWNFLDSCWDGFDNSYEGP